MPRRRRAVLVRDVGKVVEEALAVGEDDGVPVGQVEDVALALEDGDEEGRAEKVGVEEAGELGAPGGELLGDAVRLVGAAAG